jgi:hypothetical protein
VCLARARSVRDTRDTEDRPKKEEQVTYSIDIRKGDRVITDDENPCFELELASGKTIELSPADLTSPERRTTQEEAMTDPMSTTRLIGFEAAALRHAASLNDDELRLQLDVKLGAVLGSAGRAHPRHGLMRPQDLRELAAAAIIISRRMEPNGDRPGEVA